MELILPLGDSLGMRKNKVGPRTEDGGRGKSKSEFFMAALCNADRFPNSDFYSLYTLDLNLDRHRAIVLELYQHMGAKLTFTRGDAEFSQGVCEIICQGSGLI